MTKIVAAANTVVCIKVEPEKTKSGLEIPVADGKNAPEIGKVYDIGPEKKKGDLPIKVAVGDRIVYRRYTDNKVLINSEEYNFIDFKDIVGIIK